MRDRVETALNHIRPTLKKDGGDVLLVDVSDDGVVTVQLTGACRGCHVSSATLAGIERFIKNEIPEIKAVEAA